MSDARNSQLIFGIHGGGNIGLGVMGEIINSSQLPYKIIATSNDKFLSKLVNATHTLALKHSEDSEENSIIKNVTMTSREEKDVIHLYQSARIVAICLTPDVLNQSLETISKGLLARFRQGCLGLTILLLMNKPNAAQELINNLQITLGNLAPQDAQIILAITRIVPTMVDRIVTKIDSKEVFTHLQKKFPEEKITHTEDAVTTCQKYQYTVPLFRAEKNFALYVPKNFWEAYQFPLMKSVTDLAQIEQVKNKFINGPHAILAWLGALAGSKTIAEAIKLPGLQNFIEKLMEDEIAPALLAEFHPHLTQEELKFHRELFIKRCFASIDDPVKRVGRDPLRKIDAHERIRGTIEILKKHHIHIPTTRLEQGLSAAILYAFKEKDDPSCKKIVEIFNKNNHSYRPILCFQGNAPHGNYEGLDPIQDKSTIENVLLQIGTLGRGFTKNPESDLRRSPSVYFAKNSTQFTEETLFSGIKRIASQPNMTENSKKVARI